MSVRDLYPSKSKYLKASDIKGHTIKVKIESAAPEKFSNGEVKIVLSFPGKEKRLSLNKTNASILADHFGDEESAWGGNEIEMYVEKVNMNGELIDSIKVRVPAPPADPFSDKIPF